MKTTFVLEVKLTGPPPQELVWFDEHIDSIHLSATLNKIPVINLS